ncbi:MAG: alpha-2-macroglobulin family protein, partial [Pirellulales bacterium]
MPTRADNGPADFRYAAPNAAEFRRYAGRNDVGVLFSDGRQANLRLDDMDETKAAALADQLTKAGAVLLPPLGAHETGYWNPVVVTDAEGKAIVTLAVPDRSTAWKILVKGITGETLAGEAEGELVVKKDFFGELKLPLAFTDGDEAEVLATIHNDAVEQGALQATLRTTIGGRVVEDTKTLEAGKGIHELSFKVALRRPEAQRAAGGGEQDGQDADTVHAVFELAIAAGERRDVTRRAVPLEPYGMRVFATASGSASSDMTAFVEPPAGMPLTSAALEIIVGPTVERSLLDVVLAPATAYQLDCLRVASGLDTAVSDLMAAVAEESQGLEREVA